MLEQILDFIHNYFVKEVHRGTFTIESGALVADFLQNNQYFKVVGSVFNDGVHQFGTSALVDETFEGEVWAMAVPPPVIALSQEIGEWQEKYGAAANSPYQSESFGGYSYTKASATSTNGLSTPSDWRSVFGSRLNHWRKIA
jgi:hypothetical protein